MASNKSLLIVGILAAMFVARNAEAIKCHQCNDCMDANNLPEAKECAKVTLFDVMKIVTENIAGQSISEQDMNKVAGNLNMDFNLPPASCFKLLVPVNNKETIYRGCSLEIKEEACQDVNQVVTCACKGDGCNGAPTSFVPSLIAVCFSLFLSFMYA